LFIVRLPSRDQKKGERFRARRTWFEVFQPVYFFLRLSRPTPIEPRPRRPSNGSGEAVCGRFAPAL
jgi:hypothetical protein